MPLRKTIGHLTMLAVVCFPFSVGAEPAKVQTPAPVIFLEDNAGEPDGLGWCLDTQGRGFSDRLHVHSCKPQGGDVQFRLSSGQIQSVGFANKCAELMGPAEIGQTFALLDCVAESEAQAFVFNGETKTLHPTGALGLCLAAGDAINPAGPFSSKTLALQDCGSAKPELIEWVVKG